MFFIISKVLAFLLNPIIWFLTLLIVAIFLKNPRKKKHLLIFTAIFIYIMSNSFIVSEFYRKWEVQPVPLVELDSVYDAGVVLGGGMITYDGRYDRYTFRTNTDRILQGVYLYKEKRIRKIIIAGGSGSLIYRNMREASYLKKFLVSSFQIPQEDILTDTVSDNTHQNAVESGALLKAHFKNPSVLLITSAFHMRRARLCFKKQGIDVTVYATDLTTGPRRFEFSHMFMPSMQSLIQWNKLLHEWIGIVMYKIMGYV